MKNLFDMLQAIFGKNIISRTIGTRTNVIKLPTNKSSPLKNEFDVFKSAENPAVFEKLKKVIEDEAPYISRMNDAERLIYEGNVKRLHDYLVSIGEIKPTISAEVIGLGTKEPISGKGLESLVEEAGQTSPPGTLVGDIQSRINKLKSLSKEKGMSAEEILQDFASGQKGMSRLNDEGLVRSTAREILINDIKAGKIKNITVSEAINMGEPLDPFRQIYGEGALEQLDSLIPNLRGLKTEVEAEKFARSKFKFEPDENRLPGSVSIEEGRKAEQEFGINKSTTKVEEPQAEIIPFKKKPEEFAIGGSVGLDYLTGQDSKIERENFGLGSIIKQPISTLIKEVSFPAPSITLDAKPAVVRPEDDVVNRYREYLNSTTSVQSDLEKRYKEFINPILTTRPGDTRSLEELRSVTSSEVDPFGRRYDDPRYYAKGGRVGFSIGGGKKILDLIAEVNKKLKGKKSMEKLDPRTGEVTTPKKPVTTADKIKRKPTKEEYEEYAEILDDSENTVVQGNETFEQLDALVKKQKDYEDYMYMQYKRGKLDPEPGEKTQDRLNFLRKKSEEAGMIGDRRLFTFKEMKELEDLEKTFSPMGTSNKINISDPETAESFTEFAKQNDPEGFKKIQKIVDDINNKNALEEFDPTGRKPNAKGGLNYLMGF